MDKKIVLIALPNPFLTDQRIAPPLGLLYLASYLKKYNYNNVKIINLSCELEDTSIQNCLDYLKNIKADVFGISLSTTQYGYALQICKFLKEQNKESLIVIGGPHPTTLPKETLEVTNADITVIGEGEEVFLQIVEDKPFNEIKGIVYRNGNKIIVNERMPYIKDLDSLPFPARELLDFSKYTRTIAGKEATNLISTRGCPYFCSFCSQDIWQHKVRFFSAEYVLGEVDDIKKKTGIDRLLFLDDTLTLNHKRLYKIIKGLKDRKIIWRGWTRANVINPQLLKEMKDCGCHSLCVGVESGSQKILNNIHKGTTVEQNFKAVKMIKESGIMARVSIIVGSPGETYDTIEETKRFMVEAQPDDWITSTFVPVVGSDAWKYPERYGIEITSQNYEDYFVVGGNEKSGYIMKHDNLSNQEIFQMKQDLIKFLHLNVPRKPEKVVR